MFTAESTVHLILCLPGVAPYQYLDGLKKDVSGWVLDAVKLYERSSYITGEFAGQVQKEIISRGFQVHEFSLHIRFCAHQHQLLTLRTQREAKRLFLLLKDVAEDAKDRQRKYFEELTLLSCSGRQAANELFTYGIPLQEGCRKAIRQLQIQENIQGPWGDQRVTDGEKNPQQFCLEKLLLLISTRRGEDIIAGRAPDDCDSLRVEIQEQIDVCKYNRTASRNAFFALSAWNENQTVKLVRNIQYEAEKTFQPYQDQPYQKHKVKLVDQTEEVIEQKIQEYLSAWKEIEASAEDLIILHLVGERSDWCATCQKAYCRFKAERVYEHDEYQAYNVLLTVQNIAAATKSDQEILISNLFIEPLFEEGAAHDFQKANVKDLRQFIDLRLARSQKSAELPRRNALGLTTIGNDWNILLDHCEYELHHATALAELAAVYKQTKNNHSVERAKSAIRKLFESFLGHKLSRKEKKTSESYKFILQVLCILETYLHKQTILQESVKGSRLLHHDEALIAEKNVGEAIASLGEVLFAKEKGVKFEFACTLVAIITGNFLYKRLLLAKSESDSSRFEKPKEATWNTASNKLEYCFNEEEFEQGSDERKQLYLSGLILSFYIEAVKKNQYVSEIGQCYRENIVQSGLLPAQAIAPEPEAACEGLPIEGIDLTNDSEVELDGEDEAENTFVSSPVPPFTTRYLSRTCKQELIDSEEYLENPSIDNVRSHAMCCGITEAVEEEYGKGRRKRQRTEELPFAVATFCEPSTPPIEIDGSVLDVATAIIAHGIRVTSPVMRDVDDNFFNIDADQS